MIDRSSRLLAAVVVAALALTVSCSSDDSTTSSPKSSTTTTSTSSTPTTSTGVTFPQGAQYVALGTSYAAGQSIANQLETCGRSDHNYPHLLAAEMGLDLVDVTCGAASTTHLIDTPQGDVPPQLTAVTEDTALITVTTGGNDVAYSPTAIACGDPANVCSVDEQRLDASFAELQDRFTTLFSELQAKAPEATIVLVPYVRLVFDRACPELSFTPEEADLVQSIAERLHDLTLDAGEAAGVRIADRWGRQGITVPARADPTSGWTGGPRPPASCTTPPQPVTWRWPGSSRTP